MPTLQFDSACSNQLFGAFVRKDNTTFGIEPEDPIGQCVKTRFLFLYAKKKRVCSRSTELVSKGTEFPS